MKRIAIYQSPLRLLGLMVLTIFVTHLLAMVAFALLPQFPMWIESAIESVLLVCLLFPVLYFFSFRPLLLHIAEREQAEGAMRESESKYRHLFEHLSDAAFLVDVETGRILDTNSQAERLLGLTQGEIMGMNQAKLYPGDQAGEQQKLFENFARQERPAEYETEVACKDGTITPVRISGIPTILHGRRLMLELVRDQAKPAEKAHSRGMR